MSRTVAGRQQVVDPGEAFDEMLHRVVALNRLFASAGEALARPTGQTLARYFVLREAQGEGAPVVEIARRLRLARQGVQRIADVLADEGLVAYAENPRHRRAKLVTLTDRGRAFLHAIAAAQRDWTRELGERLGSEKLEQLNALLDDVLRVVEAS
jgi:DNA-binding MarR family transcriptional regulator